MSKSDQDSRKPPTFSLVLEGANVSPDRIDAFEACLKSLDSQKPSPQLAQEALFIDTGRLDQEVLARVMEPYPWLKKVEVKSGTGYFEAKTEGIVRSTGDVVVLCDADNVYLPGWLGGLIEAFEQNPDLRVVSGQTSSSIEDVYSTVFAITFFFPRFGEARRPYPVANYFGNNAAISRALLTEHPIPLGIGLLRGNDYVHSLRLRKSGHVVWRQPKSRALHASPDSPHELITRYLLRGSDRIRIWKLTKDLKSHGGQAAAGIKTLLEAIRTFWVNALELVTRTLDVLRDEPRSLKWMPLALPGSLLLSGVIIIGMGFGLLNSSWPLERYGAEHGGPEHSTTPSTG